MGNNTGSYSTVVALGTAGAQNHYFMMRSLTSQLIDTSQTVSLCHNCDGIADLDIRTGGM